MRRALATAAVLLSLTLVACGGGKKSSTAALKAAGNGTTTTAAGDAASGGGGSPTTVKGSKSTAKGNGTTATTAAGGGADPSSTTTTKPHRPVTAKLDKACVHRGKAGDDQTLTVHTDPDDTVAYSTEYSDHSNELTHPAYKTGSGYGKASTDGVYVATWKVPDDAPSGTATLRFIAEGKIHNEIPLTFKVVGPLESCS
ncbi:MAG TPA: hypothetical protein VFA94_01625 [Acidimicrobiales bacterium]|nr:hypothetical protein [Acidimicrobiales bacterium]